jgi:hypothetical protein
MAERLCLECESPVKGRKDKRFCNDYCRNSYHNKQNEDDNAYVRRVNTILRKNKRILSKLNPTGKTKVRAIQLAEEGFNFHFYTNTYQTKSGNLYYFCYDQGFMKLEEDWYTLVVKQDYVRY